MKIYVWLPLALIVLGCVYYTMCFFAVHKLLRKFLARTETGILGIDYGTEYAKVEERAEQWHKANPETMAFTRSRDGLRLVAHWWDYDKDKTVIFVHGYSNTGCQATLIGDFIVNELNANILAPDCRAHGESEGEWIGFGWPDRYDVLQWIDYIIKNKGPEHKIILLGLSMGGATVLSTAGEKLPKNVCAVCSDCGYSSLSELFGYMLKNSFHLPKYTVLSIVDRFFKKQFGYSMYEVEPIKQVKKTSIPILFIHGEKDRFIPSYMCKDLYEACSSPKELLIVPGADHALSSVVDWERYSKAMKSFCDEYSR